MSLYSRGYLLLLSIIKTLQAQLNSIENTSISSYSYILEKYIVLSFKVYTNLSKVIIKQRIYFNIY